MRTRQEVTFSAAGITFQARRLAAVIATASLLLIALGGFVRGTDAGLSCPDWPLCYGRAVPDASVPGVMQEVGHRYLASIVSAGILLFSYLAARRRRVLPRVWAICRIVLLALAIQIVLGGLTVLLKLNPLIVTAHLAMGTVVFQVFARLAIERSPRPDFDDGLLQVSRPSNDRQPRVRRYQLLRRGLAVLVTLVTAQLLLGGLVGSSGAALVCPELPLCFGRLMPFELGAQATIQMLHRLLAVAIFTVAAILWGVARQVLPRGTKVMRLFHAIVFMIALQITLGVGNVVLHVPVGIAVLHLVVAQGILLLSIHAFCKLAIRYTVGERSLYATRHDLERRYGDDTMHYPVKRKFAANFFN